MRRKKKMKYNLRVQLFFVSFPLVFETNKISMSKNCAKYTYFRIDDNFKKYTYFRIADTF